MVVSILSGPAAADVALFAGGVAPEAALVLCCCGWSLFALDSVWLLPGVGEVVAAWTVAGGVVAVATEFTAGETATGDVIPPATGVGVLFGGAVVEVPLAPAGGSDATATGSTVR